MASSKQAPASNKTTHNQRLPAPQLFVGPPSRNASSTSLLPPPGAAPQASRTPLTRQRSYLRNETRTDAQGGAATTEPQSAAAAPGKDTMPGSTPFGRRQPAAHGQGMGADHKSQQRTDAAWTEMQNTLKEVELNAASGAHLFNDRHAKALDELRTAQIALAQAWAHSEADENATRNEEVNAIKQNYTDKAARDASEGGSADRTAKNGDGKQRRGSNASVRSVGSLVDKTLLEQETEHDLTLAARRREANDRYFQKVNAGVLDVVAKLEVVAKAMKGVELESREIWGDGDGSVGTGSVVG